MVAGIEFENPIGLAAGYDKSGQAIGLTSALGFGHVEIGSISAFPSSGNPKPRLWRLPIDQATRVHYGLPNDGAETVAERLSSLPTPSVPLGINLVNTNRIQENNHVCGDEESIIQDYVISAQSLAPYADYWMLNLSCPNTKDGRGFFEKHDRLPSLLGQIAEITPKRPVFLKISPDIDDVGVDLILESADPHEQVQGMMFNLSSRERFQLQSPPQLWKNLPGAISGSPVRDWMDDRVRWLYSKIGQSRYIIIAAGGVMNAEDAFAKICAGASLVQIYTALIYQGPSIVKRINQGLLRILDREGLKCLQDAVGSSATL